MCQVWITTRAIMFMIIFVYRPSDDVIHLGGMYNSNQGMWVWDDGERPGELIAWNRWPALEPTLLQRGNLVLKNADYFYSEAIHFVAKRRRVVCEKVAGKY